MGVCPVLSPGISSGGFSAASTQSPSSTLRTASSTTQRRSCTHTRAGVTTAPKFLMFNPAPFNFLDLDQDGETILKGKSVAILVSSLFQMQRFLLMQPTGPPLVQLLVYLDLFAAGVNDKCIILTTFFPLKLRRLPAHVPIKNKGRNYTQEIKGV